MTRSLRALVSLLLFIFAANLISAAEPLETAQKLLSENKKKAALQLLEKTFDESGDPEQIKQIAALIVEASGKSYPHRDNYLRYLVRFAHDHDDYTLWLVELGDQAFEKDQYTEAEDYYLRAVPRADEATKLLIDEKIMKLQWVNGEPSLALATALKIYATADPERKRSLRLDISKLWWEAAPLSSSLLKNILKLPEADKNLILIEFFQEMANRDPLNPNFEVGLYQMKKESELAQVLDARLAQGVYFERAPCLLFRRVVDFNDSYPSKMLADCVSSGKLDGGRLLRYLDHKSDNRSEDLDQAHAKLLLAKEEAFKAIELILLSKGFSHSSEKHLAFVEELLLSCSDDDFLQVESLIPKDRLQMFVSKKPESRVYNRLVNANPAYWESLGRQKL